MKTREEDTVGGRKWLLRLCGWPPSGVGTGGCSFAAQKGFDNSHVLPPNTLSAISDLLRHDATGLGGQIDWLGTGSISQTLQEFLHMGWSDRGVVKGGQVWLGQVQRSQGQL